METPTHLKHTPIISVDDYDQIDGYYAKQSDAKALSVGYAQYRDRTEIKNELSLKVFRCPGDKWSRQSEELPLHRVLDLTILLLRSIAPSPDSLAQSPISCKMENSLSDASNREVVLNFCKNNRQHLLPRIEELKYLLETVDYKNVL